MRLTARSPVSVRPVASRAQIRAQIGFPACQFLYARCLLAVGAYVIDAGVVGDSVSLEPLPLSVSGLLGDVAHVRQARSRRLRRCPRVAVIPPSRPPHRAGSGHGPLRPELAAPLGVWPWSQPVQCAAGRRCWRLCGTDIAVLTYCTVNRISSSRRGCPDRFKPDQRHWSVLPVRFSTVVNCNPNCNRDCPCRHPRGRMRDCLLLLFSRQLASRGARHGCPGPYTRLSASASHSR